MNGLFSPENRAAMRDLWTALRDLSRELRGRSADPQVTSDWWREHTTAAAPSSRTVPVAAPPAPAPVATTPAPAPVALVLVATSPAPAPAPLPAPVVPVPAAPVPAAPVPVLAMITASLGKMRGSLNKIRASSGKTQRSWEGVAAGVRQGRADARVAVDEMRAAGAGFVLVVQTAASSRIDALRRMWTDARQAAAAMADSGPRRLWRDASQAVRAMGAAALAVVTLAGWRSRVSARRALVAREAANGPAIAAKARGTAGRAAVAVVAKMRGVAAAATVWIAGRGAAAAKARIVAHDARDAWRSLRGNASRLWATWRASGFSVPDAAKVSAGGIAVVTVILGIGYGAGHLGQGKLPAAHPTPSAVLTKAPEAALVPAAATVPEAGPKMVPLSRFSPITGPGMPPLPEDINGPQGSRRTTGTYEVALTFDDGPDPRWTPEVLDMLRQYHIKATFCVIGVNVVEFPDLVRQIDAEGHTLCNHSWAHDIGLGNRSYGTIIADMQRTNDAIHAAAPHARISYFRHPGGAWTQAAVSAARSLGMSCLHWDVDPKDWLKPGARTISTTIVGSTIPGSIVLMHDGGGDRRGTTDALRSILPNLASRFPLVALPRGIDPPKLYGIQLPIHAGQE